MVLTGAEQRFLENARVGRLATADAAGRPAVVPICFAWLDGDVVSVVDEKPKTGGPTELRRLSDVRVNPFVAVVVDRYDEDWSRLGWVQLRGRARVVEPGDDGHLAAIEVLREKYPAYHDHDLEGRPVIRVEPGHAVSWGDLEPR